MAWLQDSTTPVTNTFTPSKVEVFIEETKNDDDFKFKMVPGWTLEKNPQAWVSEGSEDCYLFVKVEKSTNIGTYIDYTIDTKWTSVPGTTDVYYIKVDGTEGNGVKGTKYSILTGDKVTVKETVKESDMEALLVEGAEQPSLKFTAYAVQLKNSNTTEFTPAQAWEQVKGTPAN